LVTHLIGSEAAFIKLLPRSYQVVNDAREFVGGGRDRFGGTHFSPHPPIEIAEGGFTVRQGLGCQAQGFGGAALYLASSGP
jgi:hypothetical protein